MFGTLISVGLTVVDTVLGWATKGFPVGILTAIFNLAILIPSLAVGVRRMHDTGRSGMWILISLVPCIGIFVFLYFAIQEGTRGDNAYGPDPKATSDQPPAAA